MQGWEIVLIVAIAIGGFFLVSTLIEDRRRRAYRAFCESRGFSFVASRPGAEVAYGGIADIFTEGHGHVWRDEISGQFNGHDFTAFEYEFTIGYGRGSQTHIEAVVHWTKADANLPHFILAPESFFTRLGQQVFGRQDITFPEDAVFSRDYLLKGVDEAAVRALFTPSVRAALLPSNGQHLAGDGTDLFWWKEGNLPDPAQFDAFLNELEPIRAQFLR